MSHHGVLQSARDALLSVDDASAEALGLGLYRRLVRGRFGAMVRAAYPHTRRYVGDAVLDGWITRWLATSPPTAREVHRVLLEFGDHVRSDRIHGACADVVRYERAMVHAANALDWDEGDALSTVDLAAPARLHASATVLSLGWDVPRWIAEGAPEPSVREVTVVVYRDRDNPVRALELGATAAWIVNVLDQGVRRLADAVIAATTVDGGLGGSLEELAALLEDLAARGVMVNRAQAPEE